MESTQLAGAVDCAPMSDLAAYHQQLLEKYDSVAPQATNPDATALTAFNGYYSLDTAAGAFFAVDTNMTVQGGADPVYDVSLLVSLDGISSYRFPFTGTFANGLLTQTDGSTGGSISLTFSRPAVYDGTTAACAGTIKLWGSEPTVAIKGTTYNNPIPAPLFSGDYYYTPAPDSTITPVKVMSIKNYDVSYDYAGTGDLLPVPAYAYNMNMYYFSFTKDSDTISLVMGTAAAKGFACNNMVVDNTTGAITARTLLTINSVNQAPLNWYDISGNELANFSGYYPIPTAAAPYAFVSIQAQYATLSESLNWDLYTVMISISLDGVHSQGYYFDPTAMTFENNKLTFNGNTLLFTRKYDSTNGSLVSLSGTYNGQVISGYTLFNPVPLSVFGGVTMTGAHGKSLEITNNNEVIYDGTTMDSIIYVPLMYILAYPITDSTVVMSFGTNGLRGNACIVTENPTTNPKTYFVYAIPGEQP